MKTSCGAHCRTCGRHFSGVTAFDEHRSPDFKCLDPSETESLHSYKADCVIATEKPARNITVWSTVAPT